MALNPGAGAEGLSRARASVTSETGSCGDLGSPLHGPCHGEASLVPVDSPRQPGYHWLLDH